MTSLMRGLLFFHAVLGSSLLLACGASIEDPEGGGGVGPGGHGAGAADGGAGGGGGDAPTTHDVEIDIVVPEWLDANEALVVWSSVTGEVRGTFRGSELPTVVQATDGDLVSYVYRSGDLSSEPVTPEQIEYIDSLRIRPQVGRVARIARPANDQGCALPDAMEVTVNVPAIPGAATVGVESPFGTTQYLTELPGSVTLSVAPCEGTPAFDLLVIARDENAQPVSFQLMRDVAFEAGGSVTIDADVADTATSPLEIDVTHADGASESTGRAVWVGDDAATIAMGARTSHSLFDVIDDYGQTWTPAPSSFTYAPDVIDPGHGFPIAALSLRFQLADAPCTTSSVIRRGESDAPIAFDATELALPVQDAAGAWSLGTGAVGDSLTMQQTFSDGNIRWWVADDPLYPLLPVVLPSLDAALLPEGVVLPPGPFTPAVVTHGLERGSYSEMVAYGLPQDVFTSRTRSVGECL